MSSNNDWLNTKSLLAAISTLGTFVLLGIVALWITPLLTIIVVGVILFILFKVFLQDVA